jgi:hypothetical protein
LVNFHNPAGSYSHQPASVAGAFVDTSPSKGFQSFNFLPKEKFLKKNKQKNKGTVSTSTNFLVFLNANSMNKLREVENDRGCQNYDCM